MNSRSRWLCFLMLGTAAWLCPFPESRAAGQDTARRPNILWLTCEDMSPHLGCYGEQLAHTPHLDRLASEGIRYTHAYSTSGVCAPSRSCLITGVYPSSLGTQFMRCKGTLPDFVRCFPEYLRNVGYYCTNNVKTDYNFNPPASVWDESSNQAHWKNRPAGQPFFAVFNSTVTHESQIRLRGEAFEKIVRSLPRELRHDPAMVILPPYYPDTPEARLDWAQYLDTISVMDQGVGEHLASLEKEGLADDTIVFFYSDHGVGLPRAKRWLYESGTHVPLIIRFGKNFRHLAPQEAATVTEQLVSFVDFAPTVLSLAGVPVPDHMQGMAFLGEQAQPPRDYVHGIRDRMDETHDLIRSVRDKRYRYIRNDMPWMPYAQPLTYAELGPTMQSLRKLHAAGRLMPEQELFFRAAKPPEELYDVDNDPHELNNVAALAEHRATLERLRARHLAWADETLDLGLIPEPELHARCGEIPPYVAIRQEASKFPAATIREVLSLTAQGTDAVPALLIRLDDSDAAVRFWAATGIGVVHNQQSRDASPSGSNSPPSSKQFPATVAAALRRHLTDVSPAVRVAAARVLLQGGDDPATLAMLVDELANGADWVRHHAALGLADLGPRAAPAREALERALRDRNEYVVRVATRALKNIDQ